MEGQAQYVKSYFIVDVGNFIFNLIQAVTECASCSYRKENQ